MMSCVGCQFTDHDLVTGVQFACRERGSRIILWMRTCDPEKVDQIRCEFAKALQEGLPEINISLSFDNFAEKKMKSAAPRRTSSSSGNRDGGHGRDGHRSSGGQRYFNN